MADGKIVIETFLDKSGLSKGLGSLSSMATGGLGLITKGVAAAGAAIGAMAGYVTKVGSEFEAQMSSVAAILGITVDQINAGSEDFKNLSEAAKHYGETTQFTATDCGKALEFLALSGKDANQSIELLPGVLNLAASGGLTMAQSSERLTQIMNALQIPIGEANHKVDEIAKTASSSGTNIAQLTDAMVTLGASGNVMVGGTKEICTWLGILADNSYQGTQGGTKLRNVLKSLTNPTDKAAEMLKSLGVSAFDSEGKMRPLNETLKDLGKAIEGMTDEEKAKSLGAIFNTRDVAAATAMIQNCGARYDELSAKIGDCDGFAKNFADTLNNNLKGKILLFTSAVQGLAIEAYDRIKGTLKSSVMDVTDAINKVTRTLKNSGVDAAIQSVGGLVAQLITKSASQVPHFMRIGSDMLKSLLQGFSKNADSIGRSAANIVRILASAFKTLLPLVIDTAGEIMAAFVKALTGYDVSSSVKRITTTIGNLFKNMIKAIESLLKPLAAVFDVLGNSIEIIIPLVVGLATAFKTYTTIATIAHTVTSLLGKAMIATPYLAIAGAIMGVVAASVILLGQGNQEIDLYEGLSDRINALSDSYEQLKESRTKELDSSIAQINNAQALAKELENLVGANGEVTDANKARVEFILNQLNDALGTEYQLNGNLIEKYSELKQSIEKVIEAKKAQLILQSQEEAYSEALSNINEAENNLAEARTARADAYKKVKEEEERINQRWAEGYYAQASDEINVDKQRLQSAIDNLNEKDEALKTSSKTHEQYCNDINSYEENMRLFQEGKTNEIVANYQREKVAHQELTATTKDEAEKQYKVAVEKYKILQREALEGTRNVSEAELQGAREAAEAAQEQYKKLGGDTMLSFYDGVTEKGRENKEEIKNQISDALDSGKEENNQKATQNGSELMNSVGEGIKMRRESIEAVSRENAEAGANGVNSQQGRFNQEGSNLSLNLANGVSSRAGEISNTTTSVVSNGLQNSSNTNTPKASSLGTSLVAFMSSGVGGNRGSLAGMLINVVSGGLQSSSSSNTPRASSIGSSLISFMSNGSNGNRGSLSGTLSSIVSSALGSIDTSRASSIGSNIVSGMTSGIMAGASALARAAANACGSALAAAKKSIDSHLPSRKFRDLIGKMMIAGVVVGIEDETPKLNESMKGSMKGAITTAQNSLGNIAATMKSSVAMQTRLVPSICGLSNIDSQLINNSNQSKDPQYVYNVIEVDGKHAADVVTPYVSRNIARNVNRMR